MCLHVSLNLILSYDWLVYSRVSYAENKHVFVEIYCNKNVWGVMSYEVEIQICSKFKKLGLPMK